MGNAITLKIQFLSRNILKSGQGKAIAQAAMNLTAPGINTFFIKLYIRLLMITCAINAIKPKYLDKPEPKIFAAKTLKHKGYINYSFFVSWRLSGRMEKVLS